MLSASTPAASAVPLPPLRRRLRDVVIFSLTVTLIAALISIYLWHFQHTSFLVPFVCIRWSCVGALAISPALIRLLRIRRAPYVVSTPWTVFALTIDSIVVDAICSHI